MPTTANDIPFEIWELIASHLPQSLRPRLISVSRYLFFLVLHERYGDIRWTILNEETMRQLRRLQDPFIAQFVQRIHIQAWFINHLLQRRALLQAGKTWQESSIFPVLQYITNYVKPRPRAPPPETRSLSVGYAPAEVLSLMVEALSHMTNLTRYSFEWRDLPLNGDTQALLETAQRSARKVQTLVLHAQIPNFKHLLNHIEFECLQELSFHFDHGYNGTDNSVQSNADILRTHIAPFINHFTPSLHRLTISSDSKAPITPLFESLANFPSLRALELNMPFDSTNFPTAEPLLRFLTNHSSSLTRVKFNPPLQRAVYSPFNQDSFASPDTRSFAYSIMNKALQSSSPNLLSNLENLFIPASGPFMTTLTFLRRSENTLTHLTLFGRYLTLEELKAVCDVFSHRPLHTSLLYLRLEVHKFDLTLLAEIAKRFPMLETLVLITRRPPSVTPLEYDASLDPFTYIYQGYVPPPMPPAVMLRPHIFQAFEEWRLQGFSIYVERYQEHQTTSFLHAETEYQAMLRVKQYVRSIKFLKGKEATDGSAS